MSHDPLLVRLFTDALSHQSRGDVGAALLAYRRLQKQFPDFPDGWGNAAMLLCGMGRPEEALAAAERAVALDGGNEVSFLAMAEGHHRLGNLGEALRHYARTLECNPGHVLAMLRMAEIFSAAGLYDNALELTDAALRHEPGNTFAHWRRGEARLRLMDYAGAEADYRRALELQPDFAAARQSLMFVLLMAGRYREGWEQMRAGGLGFWGAHRHDFGRPHWKGGPLDGKTLLVYGQRGTSGRGDNIQFARFFPPIKERHGCRILLYAFPELERLFRGLPGLDGFIPDGGPLPHFDATAPVWELASMTDTELSDLPPPAAMTPADPPPQLPELDRPGFKVGLTWAASVDRVLDPGLLDALADLPGVAWYGLQVPPGDRPPNLPGFTDMSPRMGDFLDTAQIARRMDLVATVDTATAHLAGSLGIPTIVLMRQPLPDWRWGRGDTADWYPSVRLLRQPLREGPESVVRALKAEIARRIRNPQPVTRNP